MVAVGLAMLTAGVAFIFWPAALMVGGGAIALCGVLINIPDEGESEEQAQLVDESEEPIATIARVRG
jgi:hypothetical protein